MSFPNDFDEIIAEICELSKGDLVDISGVNYYLVEQYQGFKLPYTEA
ncbi:MAG: hypothetical protein Q9M50_10760 [Methylococcales bacterium]|nr:hypothetical protein [Methylococcales bacterium]